MFIIDIILSDVLENETFWQSEVQESIYASDHQKV